MENKNIHMVSRTHAHTVDWNHMLTERIMGNCELFDLFFLFVALGRGEGKMEELEGTHDRR